MSNFGLELGSMTRSKRSSTTPLHLASSLAVASKFYGIANFLEQGIYGRVGYGGLMAIKARQDEKTTAMAPEIEECFEVIEAVMRFEPKSEFAVFPLQQTRSLAASDAAVEADNPGSGGFNLIFFQPDGSQIRLSFVATMLQIVLNFKPAGNRRRSTLPSSNFRWYCMPCIERPDLFRSPQSLWFLDNVAAAIALVRGRSSNPGLAKLGHLIHPALCAFRARAQGYWECV